MKLKLYLMFIACVMLPSLAVSKTNKNYESDVFYEIALNQIAGVWNTIRSSGAFYLDQNGLCKIQLKEKGSVSVDNVERFVDFFKGLQIRKCSLEKGSDRSNASICQGKKLIESVVIDPKTSIVELKKLSASLINDPIFNSSQQKINGLENQLEELQRLLALDNSHEARMGLSKEFLEKAIEVVQEKIEYVYDPARVACHSFDRFLTSIGHSAFIVDQRLRTYYIADKLGVSNTFVSLSFQQALHSFIRRAFQQN